MVSNICFTAGQELRARGSGYRKYVWLHSAAPIAASALLVLLTVLSGHIAPEGGLSNMQTHTMITTALTLLQIAVSVAALFWDAGLQYITLAFRRGEVLQASDLAKGFFRLRPILGSWIYRWSNYLLMMMVAGTASSLLMSLVPVSNRMYQELLAFTNNPVFPLQGSVLTLACIYFVIYLVVLAAVLLPVVYRHRLTAFFIMDNEPVRGLQAVMQSSIVMRGNRLELLKLDLRFWWYYLGQAGVLVLSMGELIFTDAPAGSWLFPLLALVFQLALYLIAKPRLALSYGLFYEQLLNTHKEAAAQRMAAEE